LFLPKWLTDYIIKHFEGLRLVSQWFSAGYGWSYRVVGRRLFVIVGVLICLWATLDYFVLGRSRNTEERTFDKVMRLRWNEPTASQEIVIVDIDEKSLSEMADEFGRWPWPREVFGDFIEKVNNLGARAIVFDIVFSDPDKFNLSSDARFNEALANAPNVFLPVIRLNAEADRQSKLKVSQIPGIQKLVEQPKDTTVGLVWPAFLPAALTNGNFGTVNLTPSPDGITRDYCLYTDESGYRLPSMALKVAEDVKDVKLEPKQTSIRINWRGRKSTYSQLSFSSVYSRLRRGDASIAALLENKILIIGTTAPALFDQKTVPIATIYPGVKIVANAIDNLISNDAVRQPPKWLSFILAVSFVALLCTLLTLGMRTKLLDKVFGAFQIIFLGVTLTFINYSCYYVDLSMPFYYGLTAYVIMRSYIMAGQQYLKGKGFFKLHLPKKGPFIVSLAHLLLAYRGEDRDKEFVQMQIAREMVRDVTLKTNVRVLVNERPMDMDGMFAKIFENRMFIMHILPGEVDAGEEDVWGHALVKRIQLQLDNNGCKVEVFLESISTRKGVKDAGQVYSAARGLLGQVLIQERN